MRKAIVVELLQDVNDLDDFGRDMVKTKCAIDGELKTIYVQHEVDNRLINVGYVFEVF